MRRTLTVATNGKPAGATGPTQSLAALFVSAALLLSGCGAGETADSGRSSPAFTVGGTIAGLDEGHVDISNGLDVKRIAANPNGLALDEKFSLDIPLPAGAGYDVRIVNDPLAQFALQCDVVDGQGTMPAGKVESVLVRCARVKSLRLLAGQIPSAESPDRDGLEKDARFTSPFGTAVDTTRNDTKGNVYVVDNVSHVIRRITPAGVVSTLAGSAGLAGSSDGTGADARFNSPNGIAVDANGNVLVADTGNSTIRRITPAGVVSTVAGTGEPGSLHDTPARFHSPTGITVDANGNVYVADTGNQSVRRITPAGAVSTVASGASVFVSPVGIAVDTTGEHVYVTDSARNTIFRITPAAGEVITFAGSDVLPPESTDNPPRFNSPTGIAVDAKGTVYVSDTNNFTIRRITPQGVSTLAGTAGQAEASDGTGADARFSEPRGIAVDATGNIYVADTVNRTVRRITPANVVSTFAGSAGKPGSSDGTGADARFDLPTGIAVDAAGNVYVADTNNSTIRRITPAGVVSTFAGRARVRGCTDGIGTDARFRFPTGVAVDAKDNVYVADTGNSTIRRITPAGDVSTFAGSAEMPGCINATGTNARFRLPRGVAVDAAGNVYVADTGNSTIQRITPAGDVSIFGSAGPNSTDDEEPGTNAQFRFPRGVAVDAAGNVYVADTNNSTIRRITPKGKVSTPAGSALVPGSISTDGTGANARFNSPVGIVVDAAGSVYVADVNNAAIRTLQANTSGLFAVKTLIGTGAVSTQVRLGALPQPFGIPQYLAVTSKRLYLTSGDAVLFVDR